MLNAAVIVAHPDDEVLWCGGVMLQHPEWRWFVLTLCRASDRDRSARFAKVLRHIGARGSMADLDDSPEQAPLDAAAIQQTIVKHLPAIIYDVVFTHGPRGEYTRHRRHEECCLAVSRAWLAGQLGTKQMKLFAYQDQAGSSLPCVSPDAHERCALDSQTFRHKCEIITQLYGFAADSWEARSTPAIEGFYTAATTGELKALIRTLSNQEIDV